MSLICYYSFSYLLVEQVCDSLFLLFSKHSCLIQLLSSNLCNSSFLISRHLIVSFYLLIIYNFYYKTQISVQLQQNTKAIYSTSINEQFETNLS